MSLYVHLLTRYINYDVSVIMNHPPPAVQQSNPWAMSASPRPLDNNSPKHDPAYPAGRSSPATNPFLSQASAGATSQAGLGVAGSVTSTHAPFIQHTRSHSMDTNNLSWHSEPSQRKQTLIQMAHHQSFQVNGQSASAANNGWPTNTDWATSAFQTSATATPPTNTLQNQSSQSNTTDDTFDPFDVAWAAKSSGRGPEEAGQQPVSTNPFATKTVTTYKVELWLYHESYFRLIITSVVSTIGDMSCEQVVLAYADNVAPDQPAWSDKELHCPLGSRWDPLLHFSGE